MCTSTPLVRPGLGLLALLSVAAVACTSGSSGSSGAGGSQSYQGPGSYYTVDLDGDGTFVITVADDPTSAANLTVNGTYRRLASGFLELTVGLASGVGAPRPGDQAIALEVPGFAFLLKPLDSDGEIIPMVVAGECPTTDVTANWLMTTCNEGGVSCDASNPGRGFFGVFAYDAASETADLPGGEYSLADGSNTPTNPLGTATCADGIMNVTEARMYLSRVGGAIVEISPTDYNDAQHVVAIPQQTLSQPDLAGDYAGIVFDKSDDSVFAVNIEVATGGGSATVYQIDEAALDQAVSGAAIGTITFDSVNDISGAAVDGWITGTLDDGVDPASPMYCMAATDVVGSGRNIVLCAGQSPGNPTKHYNAVLVSKS